MVIVKRKSSPENVKENVKKKKEKDLTLLTVWSLLHHIFTYAPSSEMVLDTFLTTVRRDSRGHSTMAPGT